VPGKALIMELTRLAGVVAVSFAVAWATTGWYLGRALREGILDVPNQRSSHRQPTPTGGGLGIIVGTLVAMATAWWFTDVGADWLLALLLSLLLGLLGFVDDRVHLGVGVRIVCQVCAALAVVTFGMLQYAGTGVQMRPGLLLLVPGVLYLVWMTNLFNFMDGIDGLAGTQAIFVAAGGALLASRAGAAPDSVLLFAGVGAAVAGFLSYNWPPARIFMGDTGSLFLGFLLAACSLLSAARGELALPVWLILWALFVCDASITLAARMLRRQPLHVAHREHAYQRLARRFGAHRRVTALFLAVNLCWLLPLAVLALGVPGREMQILLLAYAPIIAGVVWVNIRLGHE
jgi:Fuc2NAc and GlcNAc transferase